MLGRKLAAAGTIPRAVALVVAVGIAAFAFFLADDLYPHMAPERQIYARALTALLCLLGAGGAVYAVSQQGSLWRTDPVIVDPVPIYAVAAGLMALAVLQLVPLL